MADVKWIKLNVGMFDGNSFKRIKKAKIGGERFRDKLTAIWFELMDFAGKCNAGGQLIETPEIPFLSIEDIAVLIDREPEELKLCMEYFIANRMITVIDDIYSLTNWAKYQSEDKLAEIREQNRIRKQNQRERQKLLESESRDSHVTVTPCHAIEEDKEKEKEIEIHSFTHGEKKLEFMGGTLGRNVVMLSDEQKDDLLEKLSIDEFNKYVGIVAECELKGKKFKKKTHYQAILDMVAKDRAVVSPC
jgi:predicted phage replisome organizer